MTTIYRKELVSQVAKTIGKTQKLTDTMLDATLDAIVENLRKGNEVRISGYFSFLIQEREERRGLTPNKRVPYVKPAHKATKVFIGNKLKDCHKQ
jgi:DNA-binding protein HU-beta